MKEIGWFLNFINNIKIKNKLILMLILPVAGLLYFSIYETSEQYNSVREMEKVEILSNFTIKANALVHELQKERAFTVLFIDSKGTKFFSELSAQRSETDQKISDFQIFLKDFVSKRLGVELDIATKKALNSLNNIKDRREASNSFSITTNEIIDYYTTTNALFLDTVAYLPVLTTKSEISTMISAYVNFSLGKEQAGVERAILTDTFATDKFQDGMYNRFSSIVATEDTYLKVFLSFATTDQKNFYKSTLQGQFVDEVAKMRKLAFGKADKGGFGIESAHWVRMMTGKINLLHEVENSLTNDLRIKAQQFKAEAQTELTIYLVLTALITSIMIILTYFTMRSILHSLNKMVKFSQKISFGDLTPDIEISSRDEVGILANTFKDMTVNLRQMLKKTNELSMNVDAVVKRIEVSTNNLKSGSGKQTMAMKNISVSVEGFHQNTRNIAKGMEHLLRLSEDTSTSILETAISIEDIDENVSNLAAAVGDISTSTEGIADSLKEVSIGAGNISRSIDETVASLVQIDASAAEIERHTMEAAELSNEVAREGEIGVKSVQLTHAGMEKVKESVNTLGMVIDKLGQRSKEIGKILNVIDDVATETNLVALNASIIAAQAGDQGRGFAVVAERIRELSESTTASTKEITGIVSGIQSQIKEAVASAEEGTTSVTEGEKLSVETISILERIMGKFKTFQDMSLKIAKATQEQASGSTKVAQNLEAISSTIHQVASETQEQSRDSVLIVGSVEKIRGLVALIKKATADQAINSRVIASNTGDVMRSVQEIDATSFEQQKASQRIATVVLETTTIVGEGMENAQHLEEVIEILKKEVFTLRRGLERFKID